MVSILVNKKVKKREIKLAFKIKIYYYLSKGVTYYDTKNNVPDSGFL